MSQSECECGCGKKRNVLLYACSGGANVGEVADRAARELMFAGEGTMFCLAGLGGDIEGMIQTARDADLNVVIDGCPMACARKTFDRLGVSNYKLLRGEPHEIAADAHAAAQGGTDIVGPECAIPLATPLANLKAVARS